MCGLPEKQLSFLLRAGCDTLPTPMNLAQWNIIVSPVCPLCYSNQPTTNHILLVALLLMIREDTPGSMTQSYRFLFMAYRRMYRFAIKFILISLVTWLALYSLPSTVPPSF